MKFSPLQLSFFIPFCTPSFRGIMTYLIFYISQFVSWVVLVHQFFDHVGTPLCNVPTVAKVLIPKSIPTELSVLGNTSGQTSTTKLRKYPLAESLITVTDDGIAGSYLDHAIFSFPILAYVNFMLTNFKSTLCKSSCWQWHSPLKFRRSYRFTFSVALSWFKKVLISLGITSFKDCCSGMAETT